MVILCIDILLSKEIIFKRWHPSVISCGISITRAESVKCNDKFLEWENLDKSQSSQFGVIFTLWFHMCACNCFAARVWFLCCILLIWVFSPKGFGRDLLAQDKSPAAPGLWVGTQGLWQLLVLQVHRGAAGASSIPVPQPFKALARVLMCCFNTTQTLLDHVNDKEKNKLSRYWWLPQTHAEAQTPVITHAWRDKIVRAIQETEYFICFIWPTTATFLPQIPPK